MRMDSDRATTSLLRDLVEVDRRIDNARYLVGFQVEKRERILEGIRRSIGRDRVRTAFIDYDARRNPGTDRWCIACQRDIASGAKAAKVRLLLIDGGRPEAVHREDVALLDLGVLLAPENAEDGGWVVMGMDCAATLGTEWWSAETPIAKRI